MLPVWLLLAPRDYLSAFIKIGTIGLLAAGLLVLAPWVLLAIPGAVRHPRPQAAVRIAVAIVFGSMIATVLFGDVRHDFAALSDEEVAEELARNFLGYLSLDEAFGRT